MKEYDRDVDQWGYGTIKNITLTPNGKDSAMLNVQSNEGWGWSCDVHYFGLSGADSSKGWTALSGQFGSTLYLQSKK